MTRAPAVTFREAMSCFPSGVVIATVRDAQGRPWGFTASSFSSVSLEPPLVLICLAKSAECHPVFNSASWFAINILSAADEATAVVFAQRGADKFAATSFGTDEHGSPVLMSAAAALTCEKFDIYDCGDHSVIVGRVATARIGLGNDPMVYAGRRFGRFSSGTPALVSAPAPPGRATSSLLDLATREQGGTAGDDPVRYCFRCGSVVAISVPRGDTRIRPVCPRCGNIHYINPTVVVGCIAEATDGRVLMCRRQISPRRGYWTFPSGFLECGESAEEGARRETLEEAGARVSIGGLACVIDVPQISEVHLIFRGLLTTAELSVTAESSEVMLMAEADIPWESLAFTSIGESLRRHFDDRRHDRRLVHRIDLRSAPESDNRDSAAFASPEVPADL
jgi:flavin reductase (DIM6/NTAB) family NADH-FMN oxidoreductase RutF/ADP-ribose pyrophosphatase YjhB (NUDIX family)